MNVDRTIQQDARPQQQRNASATSNAPHKHTRDSHGERAQFRDLLKDGTNREMASATSSVARALSAKLAIAATRETGAALARHPATPVHQVDRTAYRGRVTEILYGQSAIARGSLSQCVESRATERSTAATNGDYRIDSGGPSDLPVRRLEPVPSPSVMEPVRDAKALTTRTNPLSPPYDGRGESTGSTRLTITTRSKQLPWSRTARWTRTHIHRLVAGGQLEIWIRDYGASGAGLAKLIGRILSSYRRAGKQLNRIIVNGRAIRRGNV